MRWPALGKVQTFDNKYPLIGPTFWVISLQYFVTQLIVAAGWRGTEAYSLSRYAISDLGNTVCGPYADRFVCSPYFTWMNASFIVLGCTMVAGSTLIYQSFRKDFGNFLGFTLMAVAGIGTILVGMFPENVSSELHFIGALLPFLFGNLGLVVIGLAVDMPKWLRIYSLLSGFVALAALVLFYTHTYLGLGFGGMERLVAYPQTIWLIIFGLYMSRDRYRHRHKT